MATMDESQARRLTRILGWLRTAKESLPAIPRGSVDADRLAEASGLVDRLHRAATSLAAAAELAHESEREQARPRGPAPGARQAA